MRKPKTIDTRRRVNVLATLGAEWSRLGLGYDDCDALRALLDMSILSFLDASAAIVDRERMPLGVVIAELIAIDHLALSELGVAALHDRLARKYHEDCEQWASQPEHVKQGDWRLKPPSRGQRMLMIRNAQALNIDLPGEVTSGEAHDWIAATGGNLRYSKEK